MIVLISALKIRLPFILKIRHTLTLTLSQFTSINAIRNRFKHFVVSLTHARSVQSLAQFCFNSALALKAVRRK